MNACYNIEPIASHSIQLDTTFAALVQALNDGNNAVWNSILLQN